MLAPLRLTLLKNSGMNGHAGSIHEESWPAADESALIQAEIEVVIQINGRVRDRMRVPKGQLQYLRGL